MDWFSSLEAHWVWLAIGLILAALELVVPGVYLIWLAVAALVTGALTFMLDLSLAAQIIDFVFLALIAAYSAKRILRDRPIASADPLLNQRTGRMVGEIATVSTAIEHGSGRVHIGDSDWLARGPDAAVGTRVRVTGAEGSVLLVEPLALPSAGDGTVVEG
jgi:membrane protein implicated in regulation of membrane protease activity